MPSLFLITLLALGLGGAAWAQSSLGQSGTLPPPRASGAAPAAPSAPRQAAPAQQNRPAAQLRPAAQGQRPASGTARPAAPARPAQPGQAQTRRPPQTPPHAE
ncbi:hypothetical protein OF850_09860, partial [Roseococcus sp. MDT2-1-1]|nr:hypothetical protein [Roseococcus sp. MDT2-1-1]